MDRGPPNEILNYALKEYERLYNENPDPHPESIEMFKSFIKNQEAYTANVSFAVPDLINSSFYVNIHDKNPLFNDIEKNQLEQRNNTSDLYNQVRNVKRLNDYIKNYHKQESFDTMKKIYSNTPITPSVVKKSLDETDIVDESAV
jgi:hypothetical protein